MSQKLWVLPMFLFFLNTINLLAQENNQPSTKFVIGALMSGTTRTDDSVHSTFHSSGMNTIVEHAGSNNKDLLSYYAVVPFNQDEREWIHFYATGLYSKWKLKKIS